MRHVLILHQPISIFCGLPSDPLQALKELCDKCRFAMPDYFESEGPAGTTVAISLPQVSC